MSAQPLDDETLQQLYTWVDEIPLSRPKRNINRDFSDGGAWNALCMAYSVDVLCIGVVTI